jgi:hypothetical protein
MLLKIAVVLAAIPLALLSAVIGVAAGTGVMVVDVRSDDGPRIVVPVPMLLLEGAARVASVKLPEQRIERELDRARDYLPAALEAIDALSDSPDCDLVRVEDGDEVVVVSKLGDMIRVRVDGPRENVSVHLPLDLARQAVRQVRDGSISPGDLVATLRQARLTQIVEVHDSEDHVKISIW